MGFPLAANIQAGAFYPPHLLFPVLSFFDAIRVLFVFHFFVAAGGIYLLVRFSRRLRLIAASRPMKVLRVGL